MQRHHMPVRPALPDIAREHGFDFHIIDDEIYWDESRAYRFTLRQIEEQIEAPTNELHQMCLEIVDAAGGMKKPCTNSVLRRCITTP